MDQIAAGGAAQHDQAVVGDVGLGRRRQAVAADQQGLARRQRPDDRVAGPGSRGQVVVERRPEWRPRARRRCRPAARPAGRSGGRSGRDAWRTGSGRTCSPASRRPGRSGPTARWGSTGRRLARRTAPKTKSAATRVAAPATTVSQPSRPSRTQRRRSRTPHGDPGQAIGADQRRRLRRRRAGPPGLARQVPGKAGQDMAAQPLEAGQGAGEQQHPARRPRRPARR